jgi:hypothetical protein
MPNALFGDAATLELGSKPRWVNHNVHLTTRLPILSQTG